MEPKWYYYFNKEGEDNLMKHCKNLDEENLLICQQLETRKYAKFKNFAEFSKYFHKTPPLERCFYEMIRSENSRKPYFDIDLQISETFDIDNLKKIILNLLGDKTKILVFTSHTTRKKSYHLVVDGLCFPDYRELKNFYDKVLESIPESEKKFLDESVYKSVQQFRIIGSHKYGKQNTKILDLSLSLNYFIPKRLEEKEIGIFNFNLSSSLITNTNYCSLIPGYKVEIKEEKNIGIGTSCEGDLEDVLRIFFANYSPDDFKFSQCKERNGNLLIVLRRLNPTYCKSCKRVHESENPFLVTMGEFRNIYFYCRRKEKSESEFLGSLGIPKLENLTLEEIPNIEKMNEELESPFSSPTRTENISQKLEEISYNDKEKKKEKKKRESVLKTVSFGKLIHT